MFGTQEQEEKPVLVTLSWPDGGRMVEIDLLHFYPSLKKEKWGYERSDRKIIAWAELPEVYNPEPVDNHPDTVTARKYMQNDPDTLKKLGIFD